MSALNRRLEKLEQTRAAGDLDIYLLQWGKEAPVTRAVYNGREYFKNEGESFDVFQARVSAEIKTFPCDGPVRAVYVWMDGKTQKEMSTENTVVSARLVHGKKVD